ncbi:MAG TPA: phosphatase PAP2 family protein [Polyangiaceae bacterium]|nr:phosphatase PAP2 family protein [Polyangiaceae bacterium]
MTDAAVIAERLSRMRVEAMTMARAALSSFLATAVDGLVYQVVLSFTLGLYGGAAFAGALMGAATNYTLNRVWTFRGPLCPVVRQSLEYAASAAFTFAGLRALLWVLVERVGVDPRIAWLPAKVLAFLVISYPLQRWVVFGERPSRLLPRFVGHVRSLWPGFGWAAVLPFWIWVAFWSHLGSLRWDHWALAATATLLAFGNEKTKRLFVGLLPMSVVALFYDGMRLFKGAGLSAASVHVCDLRAAEVRWFGVGTGASRGTVHDWLQAHAVLPLDLVCAVPYGVFLYVVMGYAVYLLFRDFVSEQRFAWGFLALNLVGFATYQLYPAAPPWYFHRFGCVVHVGALPDAGPNLTRVDAWLGVPYFAGFYARSSDVFGAVPSLHVAYPLLMIQVGWDRHGRLGRALLVAFYSWMCAAAVYLDHHWVIDVILGSLYAVFVYQLVKRLVLRRRALAEASEMVEHVEERG